MLNVALCYQVNLQAGELSSLGTTSGSEHGLMPLTTHHQALQAVSLSALIT